MNWWNTSVNVGLAAGVYSVGVPPLKHGRLASGICNNIIARFRLQNSHKRESTETYGWSSCCTSAAHVLPLAFGFAFYFLLLSLSLALPICTKYQRWNHENVSNLISTFNMTTISYISSRSPRRRAVARRLPSASACPAWNCHRRWQSFESCSSPVPSAESALRLSLCKSNDKLSLVSSGRVGEHDPWPADPPSDSNRCRRKWPERRTTNKFS